jgi:hypothetical protein
MTTFDLGPTRALRPDEREDAPVPGRVDLFWKAHEEARNASNFDAHLVNYSNAFDAIEDRVRKATGEELANPFRSAGPVESVETLSTFSREAVDGSMLVSKWRERLQELQAKHPDKMDWSGIADEPGRVAFETMKRVREESNAMQERLGLISPSDVPGVGKIPVVGPFLGAVPAMAYNMATAPSYTAMQLAGGFYGQMKSPADAAVNLISFGVGGTAKSLLKNAALNAASNMAGQAILSAPKQASYRSAGLPYGLDVWAEEVAAAGGAGFALDMGIRAPVRAAVNRFGRDTAPGSPFSRNTERGGLLLDAANDATPRLMPRETVTIDPETVKRAEAGDIAASREIIERTGAIQDPTIRGVLDHVEGGGRLSDEAIQVLDAMGVARADGMRALADAMQGRVPRMPDVVRDAPEPLRPERGAELSGEIDDRLRLLPQHVAQAVADGLEAGVPRIVRAVEDAIGGPPERFAEAVTAVLDPRTLAEIGMHAGRAGPVEMAQAIRSYPDLVDRSMPETPRIEMARDIARLSDEAYAKAVDGSVPPDVAAMVSREVPAEYQARAMADLDAARPRTMAEAMDLVRALTPPERPDVPAQPRMTEEAGAVQQRKVEALRGAAGQAYEAAVAPIRRRDAIEAEIETKRGQLAEMEREARRQQETADLVVEMWRYVREFSKRRKPVSLVQWIVAHGGIEDKGGDLRSLAGGIKGRPGLIRKARETAGLFGPVEGTGRSLDDVALRAWETGYFPTLQERPDINQLLDAIDDDLRTGEVVTLDDMAYFEDRAVVAEMKQELAQYGVDEVIRSERDVREYVIERESSSGQVEGAQADPQVKLAEARQELDGLERELAELHREIDPSPTGEALYRVAMRALDMRRMSDIADAINEAVAIGRRMTPAGTRIDVLPDQSMVSRAANGDRYQLDATSDTLTGHIQLAVSAMDPAAKMGHEAVHTLVTLGHLSPDEVSALASLAREAGTFKDEAKYRAAYEGRTGLDRILQEEAAASYIEARIKGAVDGPENTVIERIRQLIERIKQVLAGKGFKSREDVVQAVMSGEAARRDARADWARNGGVTTSGDKMFALAARVGATRIEDVGESDPHPGRVLAYHGTDAPIFDRFSIDQTSLRNFGIHFGGADLADLYTSPSKRVTTSRVIPAVLDLRNVVTIPDMDRWSATSIANAVEAEFPFAAGLAAEIASVVDDAGSVTATDVLRQRLTDIGVHGLRYWNAGAVPGWAYIVWEKGRVISPTSGEKLFAIGGYKTQPRQGDRNAHIIMRRLADKNGKSFLARVVENGDDITVELYDDKMPETAEGSLPKGRSRLGRKLGNVDLNYMGVGHFATHGHRGPLYEVGMVEVENDQRMRGLAKAAYNMIEDMLGTQMMPSGTLLPPGYEHWKRRDPDLVRGHQFHRVDEVYYSPKKIKDDLDSMEKEVKAFDGSADRILADTRKYLDDRIAHWVSLGVSEDVLRNGSDVDIASAFAAASIDPSRITWSTYMQADFAKDPVSSARSEALSIVYQRTNATRERADAIAAERLASNREELAILRGMWRKVPKDLRSPRALDAMFSIRDADTPLDMSPEAREPRGLAEGETTTSLLDRLSSMRTPLARKQRARELGFDTSRVFYHGSQSKSIDAFDLGRAETGWRGKAVHVTLDPKEAELYGSDGRDYPGAIYPLYLRISNTADYGKTVLDASDLTADQRRRFDDYWGRPDIELTPENVAAATSSDAVIEILKTKGFDSARVGRTHFMVFDPSNIRSVNAEFDPAKADSPNLMFSVSQEPDLRADMAFVDRMNRIAELIPACRG